MDASGFDRFVRHLASGRLSRRRALTTGTAGLAATLLAGRQAAAQATPVATPGAGETIDVLFAQSFESGSFVPKAGAADTYTLTLTGVPEETVWFADRPDRMAGMVATEKFVDGRAFSPADPPNGALVAQTSIGQDTLVVELRTPTYDAGTRTVTYEAQVIDNYQREGLTFLAQQQNDHKIDQQFKAGSLFIDQLTCKPDGSGCSSGHDCCSGKCCDSISLCPTRTCIG